MCARCGGTLSSKSTHMTHTCGSRAVCHTPQLIALMAAWESRFAPPTSNMFSLVRTSYCGRLDRQRGQQTRGDMDMDESALDLVIRSSIHLSATCDFATSALALRRHFPCSYHHTHHLVFKIGADDDMRRLQGQVVHAKMTHNREEGIRWYKDLGSRRQLHIEASPSECFPLWFQFWPLEKCCGKPTFALRELQEHERQGIRICLIIENVLVAQAGGCDERLGFELRHIDGSWTFRVRRILNVFIKITDDIFVQVSSLVQPKPVSRKASMLDL